MQSQIQSQMQSQMQSKNQDVNFYHWSHKPIEKIENRSYLQTSYSLKSKGFWFSKNTEWIDWCENYGCCYSKDSSHMYKLKIDFSNVLIIDTLEKLISFESKYCDYYSVCKNINWNRVASDYSGIYFDNYHEIKSNLFAQRKIDLTLSWYYGLDVNSGCVFDCKIIKDFEPC